jgi:hypothetical protein
MTALARTDYKEKHAQLRASMKERGLRLAKAASSGVEVLTGAAVAGVIQGVSPGKKIAGVPADLLIGGLLTVGGVALGHKDKRADHLVNFGLGFLAGYANDFGAHIGDRKRVSGHWFPTKVATPGLPAGGATPPKAAGQFDPTQMAEALLAERRKNAG